MDFERFQTYLTFSQKQIFLRKLVIMSVTHLETIIREPLHSFTLVLRLAYEQAPIKPRSSHVVEIE